MKKLIYVIIITVIAVYAWNKYDFKQYVNRVKVGVAELKEKEKTAQEVVKEHNDARNDLFQIMVLMNEVTINTMKLEQIGESKNNGSDGLPMKSQLEEKMKLLKEKLAEARENVKENAELKAEYERLQSSFLQREQTIRRLSEKSDELDEKIQEAINELEEKNIQLRDENRKLEEKNIALKSAIGTRRQAEQNAWIMAGDELVEAARIIPKAHSTMFAGKQSREVTRSKQMLLKSATECYNSATRLANYYGNRVIANKAHSKATEADRLFNLVTDYKSIGEEAYGAD